MLGVGKGNPPLFYKVFNVFGWLLEAGISYDPQNLPTPCSFWHFGHCMPHLRGLRSQGYIGAYRNRRDIYIYMHIYIWRETTISFRG